MKVFSLEQNNLWSGPDRVKVTATYVESIALTRRGKEPYDLAKSSGPPPRTPPAKTSGE